MSTEALEHAQPLDLDAEADVAIVGAGIAGLSVARAGRRRGGHIYGHTPVISVEESGGECLGSCSLAARGSKCRSRNTSASCGRRPSEVASGAIADEGQPFVLGEDRDVQLAGLFELRAGIGAGDDVIGLR